MAIHTIVLIPSDHSGWPTLQTALQARRDLHIDEIPRSTEILPRVTGCAPQPDVFLVAADRPGIPLPRLAQHLHASGPTSKIIVIGPEDTLDGDTLVALLNLGVPGYLTWEGLEPVAILRCIAAVLSGEVVGSPAALAALRVALERQSGPQTEGFVLTPEERTARRGSALALAPSGKTATLWADNPDLAAALPFLFSLRSMALAIVDSAEALLHTTLPPYPAHALVIDCTTAKDAWRRCHAIITRTSVPVYICHYEREFVEDLQRHARGPLHWLSPAYTGLAIVNKLDALTADPCSVPALIVSPLSSLTGRERQVCALIGDGLSTKAISRRLGITESTVKSHVAEIKRKLNASTRGDLLSVCRQLTKN